LKITQNNSKTLNKTYFSTEYPVIPQQESCPDWYKAANLRLFEIRQIIADTPKKDDPEMIESSKLSNDAIRVPQYLM
jgi:hypothetical protein